MRGDMVVLDVDLPAEVNLARIETSDHARFQVVQGGLDNVLGVVNARQWLSRALKSGDRSLADQPLVQALCVPETLTGIELLDNFRSSDVHMAFVIDEYGQVQGIALGEAPHLGKRWRHALHANCELEVSVRDRDTDRRHVELEGAVVTTRLVDGVTEIRPVPRTGDAQDVTVLDTRRWSDTVRARSLLTHLEVRCGNPAVPAA